MDHERIEAEIANHADMLSLHLRRLGKLAESGTVEEKRRAAKTANILSSRTVGLAKQARRVTRELPGLT